MADEIDHAQLVAEFVSMTGATPEQATQYLQTHDWTTMPAVQSYFNDEDERSAQPQPEPEAPATYTGPRTLDGRPAPQQTPTGSLAARPSLGGSVPGRSAPQPKKKGIATLGSLGANSQQDDHDEDDDEDYDDDEEDEGRGNLFAGGEKSGLAVQDPSQQEGSRSKKIINDIVAKAKANTQPGAPAPQAGPSRQAFRGTGMTLGGDGTESRSIPDPSGPSQPATGEVQERVLHIWQDGFSVGDGELRRFNDPAHMADLAMIRQGRAPLHLMDVNHDTPVDVKLHQHDTPYVPQPKQYKPFGGSGRRLGSPVPGDGSETTPSIAAAVAQPQTASADTGPSVDNSQPTLLIRIQLPDGTRLPARFNITHTLGDVYSFVQGASTDTRSRAWVLATTFPNKDHTDKSLVLGEMAEFKKGGTAVVKWV